MVLNVTLTMNDRRKITGTFDVTEKGFIDFLNDKDNRFVPINDNGRKKCHIVKIDDISKIDVDGYGVPVYCPSELASCASKKPPTPPTPPPARKIKEGGRFKR